MVRADELRKKAKLAKELDNIKRKIKNDYINEKIASNGFSDCTTRFFESVITSQANQINELDRLQEERIQKLENTQQLMIEGISDKLGAIGWKPDSHSGYELKERVAPTSLVE